MNVAEADAIIDRIKAARAQRGLILKWRVEDGSTFTAYPHDEAQKQKWIASGLRKGWELFAMTTTPIRVPITEKPIHSPWGAAEEITPYGAGIWHIATPTHGGFFLDPDLLDQIPVEWRNATWNQQGLKGWFEEDCDWCMVVQTFPDRFDLQTRAKAGVMVMTWLKPKLARAGS